MSFSYGGTSGRFEVAKVAARLFPAKRKFVEGVIAEDIEPRADFPAGPFPSDRLHRLGPTEVEFQTPPNADGLGTMSLLIKNGDPIEGFALMTKDDDLLCLAVRLPPNLHDMSKIIIESGRR